VRGHAYPARLKISAYNSAVGTERATHLVEVTPWGNVDDHGSTESAHAVPLISPHDAASVTRPTQVAVDLATRGIYGLVRCGDLTSRNRLVCTSFRRSVDTPILRT